MKQEVLFLLLNEYADWEGAFLAISLNTGVIPGSEVKYVPKVVAPTLDVVVLLAAFVLCLIIIFKRCLLTMRHWYWLVACTGNRLKRNWWCQLCRCITAWQDSWSYLQCSAFMGAHGFLNDVKHTSNTLPYLKQFAGSAYTNEAGYQEKQAVSDKNIVLPTEPDIWSLPVNYYFFGCWYSGKDWCCLWLL